MYIRFIGNESDSDHGKSGDNMPLSATGWNQDVVIGAGDAFSGRTVTMDGFFNWYGVGRNPSALTTGLPVGPTPSATTPSDLIFQLQPFGVGGVTVDNAIFNGGTLTLTTPMPLTRLALIGSTGNGDADITVTLNYAVGPPQVFTSLGTSSINRDWFGTDPVIAYTAGGRVDVVNETFQTFAIFPNLFQTVFATNNSSNLVSVTIADGGTGNNAIMAISGEPIVPEPFSLIVWSLLIVGASVVTHRWQRQTACVNLPSATPMKSQLATDQTRKLAGKAYREASSSGEFPGRRSAHQGR